MLKNYLKIVWRNLRKYKGYSFINIFGLATGLTCCFFIFLWVQDELSFDRFNENANHIYRVYTADKAGGKDPNFAVTPIPMAPAIKEEIPEIRHNHRRTR